MDQQDVKTEVARITQEMVDRAKSKQPPALPAPVAREEPYFRPSVSDFDERGTESQVADLYSALAVAKANFLPFKKSKEVAMRKEGKLLYTFAYAPMEELLSATVPALSKCGLVIMMPFVTSARETTKQLVILAHCNGGRLVFGFEFLPAKDEKAFGGQTTYLQRYCYRSVLGLSADTDMEEQPRDGEGPVEVKTIAKPRAQTAEARFVSGQAQQSTQQVKDSLQDGRSILLGEMLALAKRVGLTKRSEVATLVYATVSDGEVFPLGDPFCSELTGEQLEQCLTELTRRLK